MFAILLNLSAPTNIYRIEDRLPSKPQVFSLRVRGQAYLHGVNLSGLRSILFQRVDQLYLQHR